MNYQIIANARIIDDSGLAEEQAPKHIWLNSSNTVTEISAGEIPQSFVGKLVDVRGDYISLGGLDLQINGGLGLAFPDLTLDDFPQLQKICAYLWQQGVDGFVPTIVTTSLENIQRSLSVIKAFMAEQMTTEATAKIIGVHLEGPFLNQAKKGAHPPEYLLPLTVPNLEKVIGSYGEIIKIVTLAPELDPTGETVRYLQQSDIIISLGHSLATETEAEQAFSSGASMVTHSFNAMPSLHHRQPGLLGAAMINENISCGFIADGKHVSPTMLKIFLRSLSQQNQGFLVSDALAPIGLPDGVYPWDSREIIVKEGTARLADGTLSGTTLPLLVGVQNLVKWGICSVERAIATATINPRHALGLAKTLVGQPANLLRWQYQAATKELRFTRL